MRIAVLVHSREIPKPLTQPFPRDVANFLDGQRGGPDGGLLRGGGGGKGGLDWQRQQQGGQQGQEG